MVIKITSISCLYAKLIGFVDIFLAKPDHNQSEFTSNLYHEVGQCAVMEPFKLYML